MPSKQAKVLGVDGKERKQCRQSADTSGPHKVGRYGQLMESRSKDIDDPKDEQRHVNHLFGLHPDIRSPITTPDLQSCQSGTEHRGDGAN